MCEVLFYSQDKSQYYFKMLVYSRILLLALLVSACIRSANTKETRNDNPKTVNLDIESISDFDKSDQKSNVQLLNNVEKLIKQVGVVIDNSNNVRKDFRSQRVDTFTDFVQEFLAILNNYNRTDFQDLFDIFDEEIRKYHYRGCKFHELVENFEIRQFSGRSLDKLRDVPVSLLKTSLNLMALALKNEFYDKNAKELVDYLNSLYGPDSRSNFERVLNDFDNYKKSKSKTYIDLVNIVRNGIRSIIFDHYTKLNQNTRNELKYKINQMWQQYKHTPISFLAANKHNKLDQKSDIKIIDTKKSSPKKVKKVEYPSKPNKINIYHNEIDSGSKDTLRFKVSLPISVLKIIQHLTSKKIEVNNNNKSIINKPNRNNIKNTEMGFGKKDILDSKVRLPVQMSKNIKLTTNEIKSNHAYEGLSIEIFVENITPHQKAVTSKTFQKDSRTITSSTEREKIDESKDNRAHNSTLLLEETKTTEGLKTPRIKTQGHVKHRKHSKKTKKHKTHPKKYRSKKSKYDFKYNDYDISLENAKYYAKYELGHEIKHKIKKHKKKHLKHESNITNRAFDYEKTTNKDYFTYKNDIVGVGTEETTEPTTRHITSKALRTIAPQKYGHGARRQLFENALAKHAEKLSKEQSQISKKNHLSRKQKKTDVNDQRVINMMKELQKGLKDVKVIIRNVKTLKDFKDNNEVGKRFINLRSLRKDNIFEDFSSKELNINAENIMRTDMIPKYTSINTIEDINYNETSEHLFTNITSRDKTKILGNYNYKISQALYTTNNNIKYDNTTPQEKAEKIDTLHDKPENLILENYDKVDESKDELQSQSKYTKEYSNFAEITTVETETSSVPTKSIEIQTDVPLLALLNSTNTDTAIKDDKTDLSVTKNKQIFELKIPKITSKRSFTSSKELKSKTFFFNNSSLIKDLKLKNSSAHTEILTPVLKKKRKKIEFFSPPILASHNASEVAKILFPELNS